MSPLTLTVVGLIGILVGGVVNALADDLPQRRNPQLPHYTDGTPRPPLAWLGISAFLLGRRASPGGAKLSWRHPLAEVVTAFLMIVVIARTGGGQPNASDLQVIFWLFYMAIFVLITIIDIEHKLILFVVIIPSAIIALMDAILTPTNQLPNLLNALVGGAVGFGIFFLFYNGGFLFTSIMGRRRGEEIKTVAFGYGDVMMATLSGLILGLPAVVYALVLTVLLGGLGALVYLVSLRLIRNQYSMFTAIPYGPYIVAGTIIMLLFRG